MTTSFRTSTNAHMSETHIRMATRRSPTRLRVTFSDGTVFNEQQASDTFALTLSRLGLDRVEALGIYIRNVPLVGPTKIDGYASQTPIAGKYVCHHMANKDKKKLLEKIARKLTTSIEVEILPST